MKKLFIFSVLFTLTHIMHAAPVTPPANLPDAMILKVSANPKKGFNYTYYLYVPDDVDKNKTQAVLITPANTGPAKDYAETERRALEDLYLPIFNEIPHGLKTPTLVPVFPRYLSETVPHDMDRDTLIINEGPLKRIDLQTIAMFKDAREQLKKQGIKTKDKFFMEGFSSTGAFVHRFTLMHPKLVIATVSGGHVGLPTLPVSKLNTIPLIFPVGIFDLEDITGIKFDIKAYGKVPQYIYHGLDDTNDPMRNKDVYGPVEKAIINEVLGESIAQRWQNSRKIIEGLAPNIQMHAYANLEHKPVNADVIKFIKANAFGKVLNKITPSVLPQSNTSKKEPQNGISTLVIEEIIHRNDPRIHESMRRSAPTNEILLVFEGGMQQDFYFIDNFKKANGNEFEIKENGKTVLTIKQSNGSMSVNNQDAMFLTIDPYEYSLLKEGVKYTLHPKNQNAYKVKEGVFFVK